MTRRISSSRPITGSSLPERARSVRSSVYFFSASRCPSASGPATFSPPRTALIASSIAFRLPPLCLSSRPASPLSSASASRNSSEAMNWSPRFCASLSVRLRTAFSSREICTSPPWPSTLGRWEIAWRTASRRRGTLTPARDSSEALAPSSCASRAESTCSGSMNWLSCPTATLWASARACWNLVVSLSRRMSVQVGDSCPFSRPKAAFSNFPPRESWLRLPAMAMKFELQEHLGKYPIVREIGHGATSKVYLGRDPFADREVAIKVFLFDEHLPAQTERMMQKAFLAEAALAGKLNHPHIVSILDAVVEPEQSYLVMEYVAGTTLEAHSEVNNLLPLNKVVEIIFKCVRALEYAFQHGVIHRDIKPGNILLSESGDVKVSDFGASFQQRQGQETTQITGVGSPAYMSPEQIRMEELTAQTDIYSLGVTMFRLLTGRLPYVASTHAGLTYAILNTPPPDIRRLRPDLPELLSAIVMKAIEKDSGVRYKSWLEFGKDLSQAFTTLRLAGEMVSDSEKFNKLRELSFFQDFGDVALWEAIRIGRWRSVEGETVVIKEGEQGDSVFLLVEGEVGVTLMAKPLATIEKGGCFGEVLYFAGSTARRTTTIVAVDKI